MALFSSHVRSIFDAFADDASAHAVSVAAGERMVVKDGLRPEYSQD